jgi:cytochrome c biogenesis protein CcdA
VSELALGAASAFWLGLLTSISPCPLATNVAAVSYLGRRVDRPRLVLAGGLLYSLGRTLAYVALGALVIAGLLSIPQTSRFLQRFMNQLLGPVLLLTGIVLLGLLRLPRVGLGRAGERAQRRFADGGLWGALLLGVLFALSFCPISAALYFGSLVPLALRVESPFLVPALYGLGTALPVAGFALLLAFGANRAGAALDRLAAVERWARRVTGLVFIGVGVYMTLAFTLEVLP